ncbi:hypothetical protein EVAR_51855_1 [Eumeta japonica]|uniref:Uncharacterized protein n=1 Tax=Eumeta variegata TaxID=151549 RepID=A0A4C1YMY3_EUMVA|nr:hypothetical protein EVAR_51855_1 [Eumeta japonica]
MKESIIHPRWRRCGLQLYGQATDKKGQNNVCRASMVCGYATPAPRALTTHPSPSEPLISFYLKPFLFTSTPAANSSPPFALTLPLRQAEIDRADRFVARSKPDMKQLYCTGPEELR